MGRTSTLGLSCALALACFASNVQGQAQPQPQAPALLPSSDEPSPPPSAAPSAAPAARAHEWYGWQILVIDALGLTTGLIASTQLDHPVPGGVVAATMYGFGAVAAPAVHYAHGAPVTGALDFSLRAFAPPLAGLIGVVVEGVARDDFDQRHSRQGLIAGTLVSLIGISAFDSIIFARGDAADALNPSPVYSDWYGWQIMAFDAIGYGGGAILAARSPRTKTGKPIHPALAMWTLPYITGFIGAPIIHFANGEVGSGFGSLGMRLLLGPLGALPGLAGYCASSGRHDCAEIGAQWGLLGGAVAVSLFDALVLARKPVSTRPSAAVTASVGPGTLAIGGYW